jgi:hypothetical protein
MFLPHPDQLAADTAPKLPRMMADSNADHNSGSLSGVLIFMSP